MISPVELKYRVREKLYNLPHDQYILVKKALPKALKIIQSTFRKYIYTRIYETYSMPADHLASLAKFFKCRMEDMLNHDPPPIKIKHVSLDKIGLIRKFKLTK
jgi:hypothetical protein